MVARWTARAQAISATRTAPAILVVLEDNCDTAGAFITGSCDDGLACNTGEVCTSGICGGGSAVDCTGTGDQCNEDSTCDPGGARGNCDTAGAFITGSCDDGLACNTGEVCTSGVLRRWWRGGLHRHRRSVQRGQHLRSWWSEDNCDTAGAFITGSCDDGLACNTGEVCTSGVRWWWRGGTARARAISATRTALAILVALEGNCDTAGAFITGSCDDGLRLQHRRGPARPASAAVVARWTAPAQAISATRTAPAILVALRATATRPRALHHRLLATTV